MESATERAGSQPGGAEHWRRVYTRKRPGEVSWFETRPETSLELVRAAAAEPGASVVDIGGGASRLAGELWRQGYRDLTVADISAEALAAARRELGNAAERIAWVEADVREHDFRRRFDVWHDRALFHFLVEPEDRAAYLRTLDRSLAADGQAIISTFGPHGPGSCSGLPVRRYDASRLAAALGPGFELIESRLLTHRTPGGSDQQFLHARFGRVIDEA